VSLKPDNGLRVRVRNGAACSEPLSRACHSMRLPCLSRMHPINMEPATKVSRR
jgi:hypothetical protein